MSRPVLYVLAGVNGAGKSSIGGFLLESAGLTWFNPDQFARTLMAETGCDRETAAAQAWAEGIRRLDAAILGGKNHAFETTLGGKTVTARLLAATRTHDVVVWFCGLATLDLHVSRVALRVANGGHDIPEAKIRERCPLALLNLIDLMPHLAHLVVFDNSLEAAPGGAVPDPTLVLVMRGGKLIGPPDPVALGRTPEWAKPLLAAALDLGTA